MGAAVLIIGGGITGTAISRELSKYKVKVTLVEKESDIAFGGATKANTAIIHAGYDDEPGTLASELCPSGNHLWTKIASELEIPLRRTGSLLLAVEEDELRTLVELKQRGASNRVPGLKIVEKREILEAEPNVSKKAVAGLYAPTAGIICPYEAAFALAENAKSNGVDILLDTEATGLVTKDGAVTGLLTNRGSIEAQYVINAAGLFADRISAMAGIKDLEIVPRKGEYVVYDKNMSRLVTRVLFPVPTPNSKGVLVSPTIDGNLMAGPNAKDVWDKNDLATSPSGLKEVMDKASRLVPKLSYMRDMVITSFAGLRPEPKTGDFVLRSYERVRGFINVGGIKSPGLTSAPAIAEKVVSILESELELSEKEDFRTYRRSIAHPLREFDVVKTPELLAKEPLYGHVICRCEYVSEQEIREAVRRGATTVDGVKYRTRAGMGRCQGEFCTARVMKIVASELGVPFEEITKKGDGSKVALYRAKELLSGEK